MRRLPMLGLVFTLVTACESGRDSTKIVVAVWSDLAVPGELDMVRIDVTGPTLGTSDSYPLAAVAGAGKTTLPVQLELVPLAAKDVTFTVRAVGTLEQAQIVEQSARVTFVPGKALLLKLFLGRDCRLLSATCPAAFTCSAGACTQPIAVSSLPSYDPSQPWLAPDAGLGADGGGAALDGATFADGTRPGTGGSAGLDGATPVDTATSSDTRSMDIAGSDLPDSPLAGVDTATDTGPAHGAGGAGRGGSGGGVGGATGFGGWPTARDASPRDVAATGGTPGTGGVPADAGPATGGTPSIAWIDVDLGLASANPLGKVAVGNGRGDGVVRVYAGEASTPSGGIFEWSHAASGWSKPVALPEVGISTVAGLKLGDVRNSGTPGIYASGYGFAELWYGGAGGWSGGVLSIEVSNGIQWNNGFTLGAGRNDGYQRVYVADWDRIIEISYDFGDWTGNEIDTSGQWANDTVVAKGRNDGSNYLYAALGTFGGPVWELAWNGAAGKYEIVQNVSQSGRFQLLCAGPGRNDGVQRIYGWGDSGIMELSYADGAWTKLAVSSTAFSAQGAMGAGALLLADGRNDGTLRLYTADAKGVGEYSFLGSWRKSGLVTANAAGGLDVGAGRNDGRNRLYVSQDYNVHEYTAEQGSSVGLGRLEPGE